MLCPHGHYVNDVTQLLNSISIARLVMIIYVDVQIKVVMDLDVGLSWCFGKFRCMREVCLAHRMTGGHLAIRAKSCFYDNTTVYCEENFFCIEAPILSVLRSCLIQYF